MAQEHQSLIGGVAGKRVADLLACPACAAGCNGTHGDACMKQRSLESAGKPKGAPLISTLGDLTYNPATQSLDDAMLDKFREFRRSRGANSPALLKDARSVCPEYRATAVLPTKRRFKRTGLFLSVCAHGVASTQCGRLMDTVTTVFPNHLSSCSIHKYLDSI